MSGPQAYVIQNDSVIVWDSYGDQGGISVERWYPGWDLRCSPWDAVFVWNNASTTAPSVTVERYYPGWELRSSPWDVVFVWNNAGSSGVVPAPAVTPTGGAGGLITFQTWRYDKVIREEVRLALELRQKKKRLKTIERKIRFVQAKPEPARTSAALELLREKQRELRQSIEITAVNLYAAREFLGKLDFDDDEDDLIAILYDS